MKDANRLRIAWLFPSLERGNYWHPVLSRFSKIYEQTTIYTGLWPGFSPGFEDSFAVKTVGKMKFVDTAQSALGYNRGFIYASPSIVGQLLQFRPHVIFTTGFSIWTVFALLLKPLCRWRVVIAYEGSSPGVDYRNSAIRLFFRRIMTQLADAFITNSLAGKTYLTEVLRAEESCVFARPYEVPDAKALLNLLKDADPAELQLRRPVFLFIGQLIPRKGLQLLLEACIILQTKGYHNYTLLVVGDGPQREEFEAFSRNHGLEDYVKWAGWVGYGNLGSYFHNADVFVLPTLEDTWGMVVLESMTFGKPVLCSKFAGASEMVVEGENGYLFDPHEPEGLAKVMCRFIEDPDLIISMGKESQQLIAQHAPETAAQFLAEVTSVVLDKNEITLCKP